MGLDHRSYGGEEGDETADVQGDQLRHPQMRVRRRLA
jgi:hypothetical protein